MINDCEICGEEFEAAEEWHRMCWPCWRRENDAGPSRPTSGYSAGGRPFGPRHAASWMRGYDAGLRDGKCKIAEPLRPLLDDLIQLCHPDRHTGREERATRVTKILLHLRGELDELQEAA